MARYRIFRDELRRETGEARGVEQADGCDGQHHLSLLTECYYDENGLVVWAQVLSFTDLGQCDGTCGDDRYGGFFYP